MKHKEQTKKMSTQWYFIWYRLWRYRYSELELVGWRGQESLGEEMRFGWENIGSFWVGWRDFRPRAGKDREISRQVGSWRVQQQGTLLAMKTVCDRKESQCSVKNQLADGREWRPSWTFRLNIREPLWMKRLPGNETSIILEGWRKSRGWK